MCPKKHTHVLGPDKYTDQNYRPEDSIFMYLCLSTKKNWGPDLCNFLCHTDNRKYFASLSQHKIEAHMFYTAREVWKIWTFSCWEKDSCIMINEFKYGQTWKISPFPLSLPLYSTFNGPAGNFFAIQSTYVISVACSLSAFFVFRFEAGLSEQGSNYCFGLQKLQSQL